MVHPLVAGAVVAGTLFGSLSAGAAALQPHRAVYELNLLRQSASASMVSAKGRLVYDISGSACAGYTVASRFVTRIVDRAGVTRTTDVRSTSRETLDPPTYRFRNEEFVDGEPSTVVSGEAVARADGIAVTLAEPKASDVALPRAVFPTAHTLLVLAAAENGDRVIEAPIYDGGDTADRAYDTTSVVGPPETGLPSADASEVAALSSLPQAEQAGSRHYVVSYFDSGATGEPTPAYVLTFEMLGNGINYNATFDYGAFALSATLSELALAAPSPCPAP